MRFTAPRIGWVVLAGLAALAAPAQSPLSFTDYTGRGFAPDLIQYAVPASVLDTGVLLTDDQGRSVPTQLSRTATGGAVLSFIAQVAHDETATWKLTAGAVPPVKGSVHVEPSADALTLANDRLAVTLPPVQDRTFDPPVKATTLPAPLQHWRSRANAPMGAAKMLSERLVKRLRVAVVEQGEVFADAVYEIEWSEGGTYRCTVRVMHQVPLAKVTEDYDLGRLDGGDYWELDLLQGWQPDTLESAQPFGNGGVVFQGELHPMDWLAKRQPFWPMSSDNNCLGHLGLYNTAQFKAAPATAPMAGMLMLHKGDWRRMTVLEVHSTGAGDLRVRLPMSARNVTWKKDVASVSSPFSMHAFDPALPATYGKRVWGLLLAPPELAKADSVVAVETASGKFTALRTFAQARSLYGVVGLDRYKDYVLDWLDTGLTYPRVWRAGQTPEQQREAFVKAVLPDDLKAKMAEQFCTFAEPAKRAQVLARELATARKSQLVFLANYFVTCPTPSHHAVCTGFTGAEAVDDLLAQPDTTPELRRELRARTALLAYLFQEPDVLNFGTGQHPGNPNMGAARFFPGVAYVPLLADHPMYEPWRRRAGDYTEYLLSTMMAPGGGWFEFGAAYHMHGFRLRHVLSALAAMDVPNLARIYDYCRQDMDYFMNLLTPADPRYGSRLVPGMANSAPGNASSFLEMAAALAKPEPPFAQELLGMWNENGQACEDPGNVPLELQSRTPALASGQYPGLGVVFRAHQGPQETYLLLRNGFLWSHWYVDPGHFILSSRGAPLVPGQSYQYYTSPNKDFDMYNTIRFGDARNQMPYGWPDSNILACAFGGSVEYAWSSTGVPDWFINPGVSEAFREPVANIPNPAARLLDRTYPQQEGAFEWDRQVFFMKGPTAQSPNYFVFRDTTRGDGRLASFLNLNLLGRKGDLAFSGGKIAADTEFPVKLDLFFPGLPEIKPDLLEEFHTPQFIGTSLRKKLVAGTAPVSRNWVDPATGQPTNDQAKLREQRVFMRLPAAPGQGYFWVLWPRAEKEAAPEVTRPDPNVLKIRHREGVDYVFCAPVTCKVAVDGIVFEGKAGAVRVRDAHAVLAILSGPGRVSYQQQSLAGTGPLERQVALTGAQAETVPAPVFSTAVPEPTPDGWVLIRHESGADAYARNSVVMEGGPSAILTLADSVRFIAPAAEYVKLCQGNVAVRGFGPFDLTFTPTGISGSVDGVKRTLVTTWPEKLTRPMYQLDGRRWYAGWADDPAISKGTRTPQFALAFAVFDGPHALTVSEWLFPSQPPAPPRRSVMFP